MAIDELVRYAVDKAHGSERVTYVVVPVFCVIAVIWFLLGRLRPDIMKRTGLSGTISGPIMLIFMAGIVVFLAVNSPSPEEIGDEVRSMLDGMATGVIRIEIYSKCEGFAHPGPCHIVIDDEEFLLQFSEFMLESQPGGITHLDRYIGFYARVFTTTGDVIKLYAEYRPRIRGGVNFSIIPSGKSGPSVDFRNVGIARQFARELGISRK